MKSKKYIEFKEKYLEQCDAVYGEKLMAQWQEEWEKRIKLIKGQIEIVIANMVQIQQQAPIEIGCIQISLLLSSIEAGKPELMYEVYDAGMELGTLLYAQSFQTDWLIPDWEEEKNQIRDRIKELNWQSYLGEEEIKALFFENINMILVSLSHALKYEFGDFMTYPGADKLKVVDGFYLSMGEYRGWRKILYCYVETKDMLQQGLEKEFSYMRFKDCHYRDRRLAGFQLAHAKFEKCVFLKMTFHEVDFSDADFEECVFRECVFERCQLNGTVFEQCDMQRVEWKENQMKSGAVKHEEGGTDIYRPTCFVKCVLHKHNFIKNVIAGCLTIACDEEEVINTENEIL